MNRLLKISLIVFIFIGLFSDFIANDKPLVCKNKNGYKITVWSKNLSFNSDQGYKTIINPLIKYSSNSIDTKNSGFVSPFDKQDLSQGQQRHFLGTDQLGRDVLAGMIHGTGLALKIGVLSMFFAFILGLLFGLYPSYYGDSGYNKKISNIIIFSLSSLIFLYFLINLEIIKWINKIEFILFFIAVIFALWAIKRGLEKLKFFNKTVSIPLDSIVTLFTKLFQSLPGSFLILILISLFAKPSIYNIIFIIAILKWPIITRYIRAEILNIKEERFIDSSKALGLSDRIIIWRHALPHTLTPVIIALSFGFAGTILLESTLSFLGIGIPADHVSWGTLLSEARHNYSAWWLAVFPGLAIFITILIFNSIGNTLLKKINREK